MNNKQGYNEWARQYDTDVNKTRDLEARCLREVLNHTHFNHVLEIGCGTGKNTQWLKSLSDKVTAIDFSQEMLAIAKKKIRDTGVTFLQADITEKWEFGNVTYDLITFSLVLEHIEDINSIFKKASKLLHVGGIVYIGELHPFKQYSGSKARFSGTAGTTFLTCFTHHISDYTDSAEAAGLRLEKVKEYFDDENKSNVPRILSLLYRKY